MLRKTIKPLAVIFSIIMVFSCFSSLKLSAEESGIFKYNIIGGHAVLTGVQSTVSGSVEVPDNLGGYPVTVIDGAFNNRGKITSIILPDTVTTINANSFYYCTKLKSIRLSNKLSFIGEMAFCGCASLMEVEVPDTVSFIGQYAFSFCENLTSIKLSESISTIEKGLFLGCSALAEIKIPDKVNRIMADAFGKTKYYNTSNNWEEDMLYIGSHLISVKNTVSGVCEVKPGTKSIAYGAFSACSSLSGVIIYEDIKVIGERAFYGCKELRDVYYTGSIEKRRKLDVGANNYYFDNAIWHYEYDPDVKEYAPGDVNGDDYVNNKDVLRLLKYLSGWNVSVTESTLDVNGDKTVNNGDLVRLFQFISGWDVKIYSKNVGQEFGGDDQGPVITF